MEDGSRNSLNTQSKIVHRTSYIVNRTSYIVNRKSYIVNRSTMIKSDQKRLFILFAILLALEILIAKYEFHPFIRGFV